MLPKNGSCRRRRKTVVVASFALKSNVFNPVPRKIQDFFFTSGEKYRLHERQAGFVPRLLEHWPDLREGIDVRFAVLWRGFCGGLIPASHFEEMQASASEVIQQIISEVGHINGLFLDMHGAMGVEGRGKDGDAEAEIVEC